MKLIIGFFSILFLSPFTAKFSYSQDVPCNSILDYAYVQANDPAMYQSFLDLDNFIAQYASQGSASSARLINPNGLIIIPVVVHVLHYGEPEGNGFNISQALIQSQIDVLNEDFRRLNADRVNTPAVFTGRAADFNIEFRLACIDPNGNPTNGVVRKQTSRAPFFPATGRRPDGSFIDGEFSVKRQLDGSPGWQPTQYLNVWVCNLANSNGYASFPQYVANHPDEDGVVVKTSAFGRTGAGVNGLGRALTHEVGHWLNLIHIWGDNNCASDFCNDTPTQSFSNTGCPSFPRISNCTGNSPNGDMFMNYMDYTIDACKNIFTNDQRIRSRALFATIGSTSGPRAAMINNTFSLAGQPTSFNCTGSIRVGRVCLPVTWTTSGPASITSGQGTSQISFSATGTGVVQVTATSGNYTDQININVSISPPQIAGYYTVTSNYHSGSYQFPLGPNNSFFLPANQSATVNIFVTNSDLSTISWSSSGYSFPWYYRFPNGKSIGSTLTAATTAYTTRTITFNASSFHPCGTVNNSFNFGVVTQVWSGFQMEVSPNPANETMIVSVEDQSSEMKGLSKDEKILIELYDFNTNMLVKQWQFKNDQKQFNLNISSVKKGRYIISLNKGKNKQSKQVVLE